MIDHARRASELLRLAASSHSEAEAASAAVKAAKLFVNEALSLSGLKEKVTVTCPLCAPASSLGGGVCKSCGYRGPGPGHACTSRDPSVVCEVHRTWPVMALQVLLKNIGSDLARELTSQDDVSDMRSRLVAAERERDDLRRRLDALEAKKPRRRSKKTSTKETTNDERR